MKAFKDYLEETHEEGVVEEVVHSIVYVSGLPGAALSEMVIFESGSLGQVMTIRRDHVEVIMLTRSDMKVGQRVARTGFPVQIQVGDSVLGKVVDALGQIVDGEGGMEGTDMRPIDAAPLGISYRKKITRPLITGVTLVDLMVPLGMGQRELILGDRKTGKSFLARQAVINQVKQGNVAIYAAIGKKRSEIRKTVEYFRKAGVADKMIIVVSGSHDAVGEIYLTPYTAMAMAEYFRDQARDVLVVLDDMTTHAKFYRELSLLARKFPGRDSYPGDIFHIHSKLVERAGNFKVGDKEASITCLPIADIVSDDITGYIQTNLMSMTDGHVYFDAGLYDAGRRPAINPFLSVTRVGHQTQTKLRRNINQRLFDLLNDYERTQSFLRFGAELGENSRQTINMGEKLTQYFDQPLYGSMPLSVQIILLTMLWAGLWDGKNIDKHLKAWESNPALQTKYEELISGSNDLESLINSVRSNTEMLTKATQ